MTWKELREYTTDMDEQQLNTDVSVAFVNTANECHSVIGIEFADKADDALSINQPYLIIELQE